MEEPKLPTFSLRDLTLAEDVEAPGDCRVEYFNDGGGCCGTIFAGPSAEARALDYFEAVRSGQINNRTSESASRCRSIWRSLLWISGADLKAAMAAEIQRGFLTTSVDRV